MRPNSCQKCRNQVNGRLLLRRMVTLYYTTDVFRLENDIMREMETRSAVPAASEAAPRHEYRAPRNEKDRIALTKS